MKKMPCVFQRDFHGNNSSTLLEMVTPGCEWVLAGEGSASRKRDGTACLVKDGVLYKRYDAKKDRKTGEFRLPPAGAIPCDDPDSVTGHWPHWVQVSKTNPADRWHHEASERWRSSEMDDSTYELCGPHFSANPERFDEDMFMLHGGETVETVSDILLVRTFEGLRRFLQVHTWEGIVFRSGDRFAKIRRKDFGLSWPVVT